MKLLYILFFVAVPSLLFGQKKIGESHLDSLTLELPTMHEDTTKVKVYASISFLFHSISPANGIKYGQLGLALAGKLKWEKGVALMHNSIGVNYHYMSDFSRALEQYSMSLRINEKLNDKKGIAHNLGNIGIVYEAQSNYPLAIETYFKSLSINEVLGNLKELANNYGNIGNIYLRIGDYKKGLDYYIKSSELCEKLADSSCLADNKSIIGTIYMEQGKFVDAMNFLKSALPIQQKIGQKSSISFTLSSLGSLYVNMEKYDSALSHLSRALLLNKEIGNKKEIANNMSEIGRCYVEWVRNRPNAATNSKNIQNAIFYLNKAIKEYEVLGNLDQLHEAYNNLAIILTFSGKYKQAIAAMQRSTSLKDSVFSIANGMALANLENRRLLDIKELDLKLAKRKIEINELKEANRNKEKALYFIGFIIATSFFVFAIKRSMRHKKHLTEKLINNEQRFASLIEHSADAVTILSADGKPSYISPSVKAVLGYTQNEAMMLDMFSLTHPEDIPYLKNTMKNILARPGIPTKGHTMRMRHKDGSWRWIEAVATNLLEDPIINGIVDNFRDITEKKEAEVRLKRANRLYAFISQINQAIVYSTDEQMLFEKACQIAIEYGQFKAAWIGKIDSADNNLVLIEHAGVPFSNIKLFTTISDTEHHSVLSLKNTFICNSLGELEPEHHRQYYSDGIRSYATLPLIMNGNVVGVYKLYSTEEGFFNEDEIKLLEEAAGDVSFALSVFEKERQRVSAELQIKKNLADIQTLLNNTNEIFITVDTEFNVISFNKMAADGSRKFLNMELEKGNSIFLYTKPERVELLKELYSQVLAGEEKYTESSFVNEGISVHFLTHLKPIYNTAGIVDGVFIIEQDITRQKEDRAKIEFDDRNLRALINNTEDFMWSLDANYALITSNSAFDDAISKALGKTIKPGEPLFSNVLTDTQARYKGYFDRALNGETFKVIERSLHPTERWGELSFYPIRLRDIVIGTACYAHDITKMKIAEEKLKHANRMYAFISHINQAIVHIDNDEILFNEVCRIAVEVGGFISARIDKIDISRKELLLCSQYGGKDYLRSMPDAITYTRNGVIESMLNTFKFQIISGKSEEAQNTFWEQYSFFSSFGAAIILPVTKNNGIQFVFSLFSKNEDKFDDQEIELVLEAAGDVSFALEVFEKERQRNLFEKQIHHEQQRLKQAQAIAHLGNWELSFATGIAIWSDEACRIYGLDPSNNKYSYEDWMSFIHPDDLDYVLKMSEKGRETMSRTSFYHRILRKDGTIRHVYSQSEFEIKSGIPVGMYGVAHDVTEIKIAQATLEQSQKNLSLILDLIPQAIYAKNGDGSFLFINRKFAELYNIKTDENGQYDLKSIIPGENQLGSFTDIDKEIITTGKPKTIDEIPLITEIDKKQTFYVVKVPYVLPYSEDVVVLSIATDITEQKEAELILQQSQANLRLIVDIIPQAIFAMNREGEIVFANNGFAQLYGMHPSQIVTRNIKDILIDQSKLGFFLEQAECVVREQKTLTIPEMQFVDHTGTNRYFYAIKTPFTPAGSSETVMLGVSLDITKQKEIENERQQMTADIVARNKGLEQFTYIVSHNLRAPVANIIGLTNLMEISENDQEESKLFVEQLSTSVRKLDGVIKDLNTILQMRHGVGENKQHVLFSEILADVRTSIENLLLMHDAKIDSDFSAVNEFFTIKGYMYSIFINLISNSIKYKRKDVSPILTIYTIKEENKIRLVFADNGLGIDLAKNGNQIFGLYKRFHMHTEGKGMGLYMVKTQIETIGGQIEIESEVNVGTTFTVSFQAN